jgi:peptidyl-prolyl cis-trans isomerase A (cyclophilin A)
MAYGQGEELDEPGLYAIFDTTQGEFIIELFNERAPKTVGNFVNLVQGKQDWQHPVTGEVMKDKRFYDGLTFHRVIEKFMIQGGDPAGTGVGGPGYTIKDEFGKGLRHNRPGILSMANRGPDTGSSQFFITLAPVPHLDGIHAIFGQVYKGMNVVRRIGQVSVDRKTSKPLSDVVVNKVTLKQINEP